MTDKPKYEIGHEIFWACFSSHKSEYVTCPDCGGTGRLRVIFHNETMASIECKNCSRGYESPSGRMHVYVRKGFVQRGYIVGLEVSSEGIEYSAKYTGIADDRTVYTTTCHVKEVDVFTDEASAKLRADQMAEEHDREERDRIFKKEKDSRSWAWNASYHRKEIKEARRRLEYHTSKLAVASLKSKEDKHLKTTA